MPRPFSTTDGLEQHGLVRRRSVGSSVGGSASLLRLPRPVCLAAWLPRKGTAALKEGGGLKVFTLACRLTSTRSRRRDLKEMEKCLGHLVMSVRGWWKANHGNHAAVCREEGSITAYHPETLRRPDRRGESLLWDTARQGTRASGPGIGASRVLFRWRPFCSFPGCIRGRPSVQSTQQAVFRWATHVK